MAQRRLSPEERAAWHQLARSVRPLTGLRREQVRPEDVVNPMAAGPPASVTKPPKSLMKPMTVAEQSTVRPTPVQVLDSSWERRIKRGQLQPDMSIDLHGHTLALAHQRLDRALADAVADGVRILLVIAGKLRDGGGSQDRPGRGVIRAEIGHWLDTSPFAADIASVRNAHPRHGGAGAIYVILRRKK